MGKIREKFEELKRENKKAFIPYITYGFPEIKTSEKLIFMLEEAGSDLIEVGMPFSDPIADGQIIQYSSKVALDKGANIFQLFSSLKKLKKKLKTPLILMTYYNIVYKLGLRRFVEHLKEAGVSGLVVPDLLIEEAEELTELCRYKDIDNIFFIASTTQEKRFKLIDKNSTGFIYYISVKGVTGPRERFPAETVDHIKYVKSKVKAPVCVGFGISTQNQARRFKKISDGIIVGSVLIKKIREVYPSKNFSETIKRFILWLNG